MDWTQVITATIETGGLATILIVLVTLTEKKTAAMLENAKSLSQAYKELAEEYQEREAKTQALLDSKEAELLNQIKMNSSLRHNLDDSHTELAVAKMMYCDKQHCQERHPPFGSNALGTITEIKESAARNYEPRKKPDKQ